MKKYYFITYRGENKDGTFQLWNQVIDVSPMEFIGQNDNDTHYKEFVILNTCEISEDEFNRFKDSF